MEKILDGNTVESLKEEMKEIQGTIEAQRKKINSLNEEKFIKLRERIKEVRKEITSDYRKQIKEINNKITLENKNLIVLKNIIEKEGE